MLSNSIVSLSLSRNQASFLQANLSQLALNTRQAMTQTGLERERHMALTRRAVVLEMMDDAVRSALLEVPNSTRKSARGIETSACARGGQASPVARHGGELPPGPIRTRPEIGPADAKVAPKVGLRSAPPVRRVTPTATPIRNVPLVDVARSGRVLRVRSNEWLSAFLGERSEAGRVTW
jgi:hypothetical protein